MLKFVAQNYGIIGGIPTFIAAQCGADYVILASFLLGLQIAGLIYQIGEY